MSVLSLVVWEANSLVTLHLKFLSRIYIYTLVGACLSTVILLLMISCFWQFLKFLELALKLKEQIGAIDYPANIQYNLRSLFCCFCSW